MATIKLNKEKWSKEPGDLLVCEVDCQMNPPIVHVVMPTFGNQSVLTAEDRAKLKNCYDTLLSKAEELKQKKIVLPFLGIDWLQRYETSTKDAIDIAFSSAFGANANLDIQSIEKICFMTTSNHVADTARSTQLYKNRKKPLGISLHPSPCSIGQSDKLTVRNLRCEGKHITLQSTINSERKESSDLFGCMHEADLIMSRIGIFDVDWASRDAANFDVCDRHLKIFLRDWENPFYKNFKTRDGNAICSFPDHQGPASILIDRTYCFFVSKTDSKRWMMKKQTILKVGSPCAEMILTFFVRGTVETVKRIVLVRYDEAKLDKLIEFILSPLVALHLPFGEREEKMDDGSKMSMPNLQRLQTIDEVYRMYLIWLEEEGIPEMALKETAAKYIIKLVAPTRRKNLTCVDEKIADGKKAFDELFRSVSELLNAGYIDKQSADNLIKHLQSGKAYLRGDFKAIFFKVHVNRQSSCADHCATFALSDPNSPLCFVNDCDHYHDIVCERERFFILNEECAINCEVIKEMKKHQIRAALSHMEKTDYVKSLKPGQALVTLDWAQKLCPLYAREKQTEYYAKSGIAYHMSHAETVLEDGNPAEHLSVHIFKPGEKQDGPAVYLIIESFLNELKKMGINRVMLRSDCAGCYRNAPLICSLYNLQKKINIVIDGLLFSEAQAGKGPCDRGSARVKGKTRDHVTSTRGKVETSEEFFKAVTTGKLLNGVSIHQCAISNVKNGGAKIGNITSYSSFQFEHDGIKLRRHRSIGKGLLFNPSNQQPCEGKLATVQSGGHTIQLDNLFWLTSTSHRSLVTNSIKPVNKECTSRMLQCWEEGCVKEFRSFHQLQRHISSGQHEYELERKTMHDYCAEMAALSLSSNKTNKTPIDSMVNSAVHSSFSELPQGWALREPKQKNKNDQEARKLIRQFFADKRSKNLKANAHEAEIFMKTARGKDGELKVYPRDRLSITQIKSIFRVELQKEDPSSSTVKKKKPPTTPNDTLDSSDEEQEEAVAEDFSDSDDEEVVRAHILDRKNEMFEKEENREERGRKRQSFGN